MAPSTAGSHARWLCWAGACRSTSGSTGAAGRLDPAVEDIAPPFADTGGSAGQRYPLGREAGSHGHRKGDALGRAIDDKEVAGRAGSLRYFLRGVPAAPPISSTRMPGSRGSASTLRRWRPWSPWPPGRSCTFGSPAHSTWRTPAPQMRNSPPVRTEVASSSDSDRAPLPVPPKRDAAARERGRRAEQGPAESVSVVAG